MKSNVSFEKTYILFSLIQTSHKRQISKTILPASIDKAIFFLSIPMILEMAMESLFAIVDVYFVSKLNDNNAVATIGLTESILTLIYSLAMGLSMGATAMVSRSVGEKDIKAAEEAAAQAVIVGLACRS